MTLLSPEKGAAERAGPKPAFISVLVSQFCTDCHRRTATDRSKTMGPSRAEAVRRLVGIGLKAKDKC